jgi:hypothetical protein
MTLSVHRLVATMWVSLVLSGCSRTPSPARPALDTSHGELSWSAVNTDRPVPGIDAATVYYLSTTFVLWSDVEVGESGGGITSTEGGLQYRGSLRGRDGKRFEFRCETSDGKTGSANLDGKPFNLADGNLFLVCTEPGLSRVKQLKRDMNKLKIDRESLAAFGGKDAQIVDFFGGSAGAK